MNTQAEQRHKTQSDDISQGCNHAASRRIGVRFSTYYAGVSLMVLVLLIVIAGYVRDSFIRPTFGDVLVVVWLYHTIASVIRMDPKVLALLVVAVAFLVEVGQYFQMAQWLGIEPSSPLHIALGATFDWKDLFAYAIGGVGCVVLESRTSRRDSDLGSKVEREKLNE
ncbi:DUF2809 domain-containing protein [Vibrio neptunius]|uniref:ribosomal maturation YjgA family protein n=1 Tax=Vibrio neptunius TaxID=170651 RepID=UPI00214E55AA|nr:DUF2809 domain-containing protein [Vibrio neptunius]